MKKLGLCCFVVLLSACGGSKAAKAPAEAGSDSASDTRPSASENITYPHVELKNLDIQFPDTINSFNTLVKDSGLPLAMATVTNYSSQPVNLWFGFAHEPSAVLTTDVSLYWMNLHPGTLINAENTLEQFWQGHVTHVSLKNIRVKITSLTREKKTRSVIQSDRLVHGFVPLSLEGNEEVKIELIVQGSELASCSLPDPLPPSNYPAAPGYTPAYMTHPWSAMGVSVSLDESLELIAALKSVTEEELHYVNLDLKDAPWKSLGIKTEAMTQVGRLIDPKLETFKQSSCVGFYPSVND